MDKRFSMAAYLIVAAAVLTGILLENNTVYFATKPLLMVTLFFYFWRESTHQMQGRLWVAAALLFSWLGDVFLMAEWGFMPGLGSFLLAHLCFMRAYWLMGAKSGSVRVVDVIKFLLVGVGLMWVLYPGLGAMFVPVLVYAIVLLGMAIMAHKRRKSTTAHSFSLVAAGAVFFVVSDALIAINRFAFEVPFEILFVMSTYILAQYLIALGLLKHTSD